MRLSFTLNIIAISALILLPYFLFGGKLFIGGDDTRLFYAYPAEYLKNVALYSWINLSSFGWNFSYQSFVPFTFLWSIVHIFIPDKVVLHYFAFSLPFIFGFIYFQKLFNSLVEKPVSNYEGFIGSLFYVLSPIIISNHFLNPLIPIWLIGLIPAVCYYLVQYIKGGSYFNILKAVILTSIFSFGSHNIPWIGGFLLPVLIGLVLCSIIFKTRDIVLFAKRTFIFLVFLVLSQMFWLYGFMAALLDFSSSSFTSTVTSETFTNEFRRSIEATARGNIIYPLLNLYPRQIAFDFGWNLKNIYLNFFDKTYFLNLIYIALLFFGLINFRKHLEIIERKIFLILLFSFILSLYFFTINIGFLFDFYILLGEIPGFIIFRNPYDKFALGYTLIYSVLISYSLLIFSRKYSKSGRKIILSVAVIITIIINGLTIKETIVSPLWTTENIYKNITISKEYLNLMENVESIVPSTTNILSIPYGLALYTIIKDTNSNNVYAGVSPLVILSGINDISGFLSFNYMPQGDEFSKAIIDRDYDTINRILYSHNISFVLVTKNLPEEVKRSYLFVKEVLKGQDNTFLSAITDKKIFSSSEGNYDLYSIKKKNSLISSENLSFKKINRIKYTINIKNLKGKQELLFNDSFHKDWNLYLESSQEDFGCQPQHEFIDLNTVECKPEHKIMDLTELKYLFKSEIFGASHEKKNGFSNAWTIDSSYVKKNFDKRYYVLNQDGSININLVLFFKPQLNFYVGSLVSFIVIFFLAVYSFKKR